MLRRPGVQCALCILLAILAVAPWLGSGGLNASEGLRVAAGLDLITRPDQTSSWLTQTIFEQPYLRKPPGIAWTIALMHQTFGFSEWAYRLPSALSHLLLTLLAFTFTQRVIVRQTVTPPKSAPLATRPSLAPFAAGLAAALTPLLWEFARAAEIEALTLLTGALTCAGLMAHALIRSRIEGLLWLALAAVGIAGTLLFKGPATLPVIFACLLACELIPALLFKGERSLINAAQIRTGLFPFIERFTALTLGSLAALWLLMHVARATGSDSAVTQSPAEFLWAADRLPGIAALPISALITMLPASLALLWLLLVRLPKHGAPTAPAASPLSLRDDLIARITLIAAIASLVIFALAGISNPRYAAPAIWPVLLLVPVAVVRYEHLRAHITSQPTPTLARILGFSRNLFVVLTIACVIAAPIYAFLTHRSRVKNSGLTAARALATALQQTSTLASSPTTSLLFADDAIEARAEVLLYLRALAAAQSPSINLQPIWVPGLDPATISARIASSTSSTPSMPSTPPGGPHYLLLRADGTNSELTTFRAQHPTWNLTPLASATTHIFTFQLCRIEPATKQP